MGDAPYRDDREADQARIASLEAELAQAKDRVAQLEHRQSTALVLASQTALSPAGKPSLGTRIAGAPMQLHLERTFDRPYPVDKLEDLVDPIRAIMKDRGHTELLRSSLGWSSTSTGGKGVGPFVSVTVTVRDGATHLAVSDRLGQLAGAFYGGIGGGVGGGGITLPIFASIAVPVLTPVFFATWLGGAYAVARGLFTRSARKRAQRVQAVFDAVAADIDRVLSSQPRPT